MIARCLMIALAMTWIGCNGSGSHEGAENGPLGALELHLTGTDSHGQQYRLRNAEFNIVGYSYYGQSNNYDETVSSEADPDAEFIETRLVPGSYYVTLANRLWYLEKLTPNGPERVADAVLLSDTTVYTYVSQNSTSDAYFTFGVDGQVIDFRHGKLRIGISIEHPNEDDGGTVPEPEPEQDAGH
jgi:hypothetical protein